MKVDLQTAVTRQEGAALLLERWTPQPRVEHVPLSEALGRVTAEDLYSINTLPVCRVSACDGIAVRSADFENGIPDPSGWVKGEQFVCADTGDDFPDEYDSIIAVEEIFYDEQGRLHFQREFPFVKGDGVRAAGSMLKKGDLLVRAHTRITPELTVALAAGGIDFVPVLAKLKVAFLPTGTELIPAGIRPERGQNVETNSLLLSGLLKGWGAEPICFPITKDDRAQLSARLDEALGLADIVILNGGSSRGEEDFNCQLLQERAEFFRHGVRAVPGRPVGMSIIGGKPVLNLPGPVLAAWLAADWLLQRLVCHYYGLPMPKRQQVTGILAVDIKKPPHFEMLHRVRLEKSGEDYLISPIPRGSDTGFAMREASALLTIPIGCIGYAKGDRVTVELLKGEELI